MKTKTSICVAILALSIGTSRAAEPAAITPAFGFDLSFGYALPNDHRLTGSVIGFELSLLEVAERVRVSYYHEQGHWHGHDGDENVSARSVFNAIHFNYQIYADDVQQVSIIANAGHIQFHEGLTKSAFAADLGVHYDPLILSARGVTTNFGVLLAYRYGNIDSTEVFGVNAARVDDVGGFIGGVHGLVRF